MNEFELSLLILYLSGVFVAAMHFWTYGEILCKRERYFLHTDDGNVFVLIAFFGSMLSWFSVLIFWGIIFCRWLADRITRNDK